MENTAISRMKTWVALGDSITYGYPQGPEVSWVGLVAKMAGVTIINRGINGDTTADMLARFDADVAAARPESVLIMGGLNDVFQGVDVQAFCDHLQQMVDWAREADILPVVGIAVPIGQDMDGQCCQPVWHQWASQVLPDLIRINKLPFFDIYQPMIKGGAYRTEYSADGVHLNMIGNRYIADSIYQQLQQQKLAV